MGVELVARGRYLGYFPEISVRGHLRSKRLRALRGLPPTEPFRLHAVHRSGASRIPAAIALERRVAEMIRDDS